MIQPDFEATDFPREEIHGDFLLSFFKERLF